MNERAWPTPPDPSAAEAAIGGDDPHRDWDLRPETHAYTLPPEAGALKRILQSPEIKRIMERYSERDREAVHQQARYRRARRHLVILAYGAALTGLFALSVHLILAYVPDTQPLLVLAHVALLSGLLIVAGWLNHADPRSKWLAARSEAEQLRVALFDRVLATDQAVQDAELPLLPLKLAYFRRYQLDVQLRYFGGRGKQLERTVGLPLALTLPTVAIALLVLGFGLAFLAHVADEYGVPVPDWVLLATRMDRAERIAGWAFPLLALSTLYAFLSQRSVSEDARAGTRYLAIFKNLNFLKDAAYEEVRRKAEAGEEASVARFVGLVHGLMIAEQSQWISFQGLVDHKDSLLADRSAAGLAELFAGRFAETREEMARPSAAQRSGSSFAVTNARWLSEPIVTSSPVIEVREPVYETAPRATVPEVSGNRLRPSWFVRQGPLGLALLAVIVQAGLIAGGISSFGQIQFARGVSYLPVTHVAGAALLALGLIWCGGVRSQIAFCAGAMLAIATSAIDLASRWGDQMVADKSLLPLFVSEASDASLLLVASAVVSTLRRWSYWVIALFAWPAVHSIATSVVTLIVFSNPTSKAAAWAPVVAPILVKQGVVFCCLGYWLQGFRGRNS